MLGYTQSAISGQILALERAVGARLLERVRGSRPVQLTEEGRIVLRHAGAINARLEAAQSELAALHRGARDRLRIGVHQAVSRAVVPETLRRLADEDPAADVELREIYDTGVLLDALERGKLDLAFTALPVRDGPFSIAPVYRDEHVLVVRRSDPLAARAEIALDALRDLSVITIDDCRAQSAAEDAIAATGRPLTVSRRLEDTASILAFVSAGLGVGFIPACAAQLPLDLVAIPLDPAVPPRVIAAVWHRDLELSARGSRFVELASSVAGALGRRPSLARAI